MEMDAGRAEATVTSEATTDMANISIGEQKERVRSLSRSLDGLNEPKHQVKRGHLTHSMSVYDRREERAESAVSILKEYAHDGNDFCADCRAKSPRWAIVNHGVLVCGPCSIIHEQLGSSIKDIVQIHSLPWAKEVLTAVAQGNAHVNDYLERGLPKAFRRPNPDERTTLREQFIYCKYRQRLFQISVKEKDRAKAIQKMRAPYLFGDLEGTLLKRGREKDEWLERRCVISVMTSSIKYFKPSKDASSGRSHQYAGYTPATQPLRELSLATLDATLVLGKDFELPGKETILLLLVPDTEKEGKGKKEKKSKSGPRLSHMAQDEVPDLEKKTRTIFMKTASKQSIIEWYVAIRQARISCAFVKPNEEPTHDFTRFGWMFKKGRSEKDAWKRRWFVLHKNQLRYYEQPTDPVALGEIDINNSPCFPFEVHQGLGLYGGEVPHTLTLVTPWRRYWFRAPDADSQAKWIYALSDLIGCQEDTT